MSLQARRNLNSIVQRFASTRKVRHPAGPLTFCLLLSFGLFLLFSAAAMAGQNPAAPGVVEKPHPPLMTRVDSFHFQHAGKLLRSPVAIACDPHSGDLAIASFESREVVLFNSNGALLYRLGRQAGLKNPNGVAIDTRGRIYVSDLGAESLKIFSPAGQLLDEIRLQAQVGHRVVPGRVSIDEKGRVYLVDLLGNEVLLLDDRGSLLSTQSGFKYLQKAGPAGSGQLIVVSGQGKAVSLFDPDGEPLVSFGKHGDSVERNVSFPTGFAIDSRDRIWLADAFQHRLKVFSRDGHLLFNYGRLEEQGGGFFFPVDLCFGKDGRLFVLEKGANRVQVFKVEDLQP